MAKHFAIALDENRHIFHPGETISGVLLLNTDKELTLRSIRVELIGMGRVSIREYKTTYVNRRGYVNLCKTLLGGQTGTSRSNNVVKLQPGNYSLPFQFSLPPRLPSSFQGQYGGINYWIHAEMARPYRANMMDDTPLFIIQLVQIRDPALLEPRLHTRDRTLGWSCCPSGQLYAKARVDRRAYCPGQEVKITGHVSNQSGKQVICTEVQFVQKAVFKAPRDNTRTVTEKLYAVTNERGLAPGEESDIQFDSFSIPAVQPTTEGYGCVDITYEIRFIVRVAHAFNTKIVLPVIVATVPLGVQPSLDPALIQRYKPLANYLLSRAAAVFTFPREENEGNGEAALQVLSLSLHALRLFF